MATKYSRTKLVAYIADALSSRKGTTDISSEIAAYLISINKTNELNSIMRDVQERRAVKDGIVEMTTRSAHDLGDVQLTQVKEVAKNQYRNAKSVIAHQERDESVIGGTSIQLPHASLDVTIRAKLNQLRESIS